METKGILRHIGATAIAAFVFATVFTAWTPASLSPSELAGELIAALDGSGSQPADSDSGILPADDDYMRIGLVVGHLGINPSTGQEDPGSVCQDGLTELEVNREIGLRAARALEAAGLKVDILDEFDPRLFGYRAVALISIHADACIPINDQATGFKVASALDTIVLDRSQRLVDCVVDRYTRATGLHFHEGSITRDMTEYHSFNEIHNQTPAAIIETGFLYLDRDFLTANPDLAAKGIADGILCYVNNEPIALP
jgi:N-acetylmuramoyl-L-alanine amidase